MIRGYAAEFGLTAAKGLREIEPLLARIATDAELPELAKELFAIHAKEFARLQVEIKKIEAKLMAWHRHNALSRELAQIPGVGPISAALAVMKVADPKVFRSGRDFSAWIGLTPKDHSTAGKTRLGVITRAGDEVLRSALVVGATSVIQKVRRGQGRPSSWLADLVKRKPPKLAAVALANKNARIMWKLMVSGECYNPAHGGARAERDLAKVARSERRVAARRGGSAPRPSLLAASDAQPVPRPSPARPITAGTCTNA
jgi:transposase